MQQRDKSPSGHRRLDRDHEELEVLNDMVRRLVLKGVPGAVEIYRRNRELLKLCERSRGQKAQPSRDVSRLTSHALRESQELIGRMPAARGADRDLVNSTREPTHRR